MRNRQGETARMTGGGTRVDEAIIVLGAATRPDGSVSPALVRRARHGAGLAHERPAALVILSGGAVRGPVPEAEAMAELVVAAGVERERLLLEARSRSTLENARESLRILAARCTPSRIIVVTDRVHAPRALACFKHVARRAGVNSELLAEGVQCPDGAAPRLRETVARLYYAIRHGILG